MIPSQQQKPSPTFNHALHVPAVPQIPRVHGGRHAGADVQHPDGAARARLGAGGQEHEAFLGRVIVEREGVAEYLAVGEGLTFELDP